LESGGRSGSHYLSDLPAVLVGSDELCDLRGPRAPKNHVVVMHAASGCDVRYLGLFGALKVRGRATKRAKLKNGDVVECGGLTVTFLDDVA